MLVPYGRRGNAKAQPMSKAGKLRNAQAQAERALKNVERAKDKFVRDYAQFPKVLGKGLPRFARAQAGLKAMIATCRREVATLVQKQKEADGTKPSAPVSQPNAAIFPQQRS